MAYSISGLILKRMTITKTFVISYAISLAGGILYLVFHQSDSFIPIFIILSRVGNGMSFNVAYISNARLFPTKFLSTTFGIANLVSHLITIAAPMVAEIKDPYPYLIFNINMGAAIVACLFLKEYNEEEEDAKDRNSLKSK